MTTKTRPLLIALHGWGARGCFFNDLAERLDCLCEVIAPDFTGHGKHQDRDEVTLSDLANQVNDIVKKQPERTISLLGWSMGAAAAFTYLDLYGTDHISGLIIEDMSPKPVNDEHWQLGIANGYQQSHIPPTLDQIRKGWNRYGRRVWKATFASPEIAKGFETDPLYKAFLDNRETPLANAWASLMEMDARELVKTHPCPMLALMGASSHVYGSKLADWYEEVLGKKAVYRLEGAGHAPHLEKPEAFSGLVAEFIQTHC